MWGDDFLGLGYLGSAIDRSILDIREWTTKKTKKTMYLIVGSCLAKVMIEATMNEAYGRAGMSCKVLEIDGKTIPRDDQEKERAVIHLVNDVPTPQEQINLVLEALGNFKLYGRPAAVSDDYARGHLRALEMKVRIGTKTRQEKEAAQCS